MVNDKQKKAGIGYAAAAYIAWGILPLYWKALQDVPASEILAHRIFWSFFFVAGLLFIGGRLGSLREVLQNRAQRKTVFVGAVVVSLNWFIYIWAVNTNHVVEASLGYYINPLISMLLGTVILKERLNFWQLTAFVLAGTGVVILTAHHGSVPWISLALALSFGFYGLIKKVGGLDSLTALTMETGFLTPLAFLYLLWQNGVGFFGTTSAATVLLLVCCGVITALPLLWFANAAARIDLSTLGILQYFSPSLQLFLGVVVFREAFTVGHAVSFPFIWTALVLYALAESDFMRSIQPARFRDKQERGRS